MLSTADSIQNEHISIYFKAGIFQVHQCHSTCRKTTQQNLSFVSLGVLHQIKNITVTISLHTALICLWSCTLRPTCVALNRPHGVAHCNQHVKHVWPGVRFKKCHLLIRFSSACIKCMSSIFHSEKPLLHVWCTTMIFLGIQFCLLQASKIVPWPLVSSSRELGVMPESQPAELATCRMTS